MIPDSSAQSATLPATNVAREMMKNGATEHLRLAIQMAQERAIQYQAIVDQEAERLQEEIDALGDTQPEGMHPGQRLLGLISDAAYYMNDFITRLAAIYQNEQKLRQGDEKLAQGARQQAFREAEAKEKNWRLPACKPSSVAKRLSIALALTHAPPELSPPLYVCVSARSWTI